MVFTFSANGFILLCELFYLYFANGFFYFFFVAAVSTKKILRAVELSIFLGQIKRKRSATKQLLGRHSHSIQLFIAEKEKKNDDQKRFIFSFFFFFVGIEKFFLLRLPAIRKDVDWFPLGKFEQRPIFVFGEWLKMLAEWLI